MTGKEQMAKELISPPNTPSTSAKESNENDLHMKSDKTAFTSKHEEDNANTIASERLRYEYADEIYPE